MIQNTQAQAGHDPLAILFTNSGGRVIFANRNFLDMAEETPSKTVSGEQRLEAILPIEPRTMSKIISVLSGSGFIDRMPVSMLTTTGKPLSVLFSGVAAFGAKGDYIGADIFLLRQFTPAPPDSPTVPALRHTAILKMYVAEVFAGTRSQGHTYMQGYVVAQIEVLQVLLARMGGPEARNTLERTVNEVLARHAVPARMKNGYLEFDQKSIDISIYRVVLQAAIRYARDAIGQRVVGQEMLKVDSQLDAGLLQLLTQMDLRPTTQLN